MGIKACQKAVFTRREILPWIVEPNITDTEECAVAITEKQARLQVSKFASPETSYCGSSHG